MADTNGGGTTQNTEEVSTNGAKQMGTCERVESEKTRGTFHSPSFHINTSPKFHVANIQRLLTKKELKEKGIIIKEIEKIKFLRDMCKEEKPYFLVFAETWLKDKIKEAEYEIEGYSHVASHRKDREGGGVIIYIEDGATYRLLASVSDEMCSVVAVHLEEPNLIVFMVYRPSPNNSSIYCGDKLVRSFNDIVISNINKVIGEFQSPTPDIILTGDFNFPKAVWDAGIGTVQTDDPCNMKSLQHLIDLASRYNLLQTVTEGTRVSRNGHRNILELVFTNNHELITGVQVRPSEITDHE